MEFGTQIINVDRKQIKLQIWDTAEREMFRPSLRRSYYRGSHGILIIYDVTNKESFNHIKEWLYEIENNANDDICKIIVGNKIDLKDERVVSSEDAAKFCEEVGIKYIETSAKDSSNIEKLFHDLAIMIYQQNDKNKPKNGLETSNTSSTKNGYTALGPDPENKRCCVIL